MTGCFFALSALFFFIGLVTLLSPDSDSSTYASQSTSADEPAPRIYRGLKTAPSRRVSPQPTQAPISSGANTPMTAMPSLSNIQIGQRIRVRHPDQGELTLYVMGRVIFDELWQQQRSPQAPWVPTGNAFSGFWLETNQFLLNWQNRYYLLDEMAALSDAEIQRDFAPHARKFAQSDQTAEVLFAYPPAMWKIEDIGKFRVRQVEGEGLRHLPGAVGRFVHASGDANRGLVLEDYEGGGQDVVWTGKRISAEDIQA